MASKSAGSAPRCVLIDLNTQNDFCSGKGAHPVLNISSIIPALRSVVAWTKRNGVPVVSSVDSHRASDFRETSRPRFAMDGTNGQQKLAFTMFPRQVQVQVDNTLAIPLDLFDRHQQVVFRQRGEDLLANPKADRFLTQLQAAEFVVFGNSIEGAVKNVALGLIAREKKVTVIPEACGYWDPVASDLALRLFSAKGVHTATIDELLERKIKQRVDYRARVKSVDNVEARADAKGRPEPRRGAAPPPSPGRVGGLSTGKSNARISRRRGR